MATEKAKGPGYEDLHWRVDDMLYGLVQDYKARRPLAWPVVPVSLLHRVWASFVEHGTVRDDAALDGIFGTMRDCAVRLQIANIVSGHESVTPDSVLGEFFDETEQEAFCSWLIDTEDGSWRISDYGLGPIQDAIALAFEARTLPAKLKYLDRALNVVHQRGDLSKLFVEGGRATVIALAG